MAGFFVGATSAGFVGDKFGRKIGLILFHLLTAICLVLNGWLSTWNYYAYCIFQMFTVSAVHAACLMQFVYSMEIIGPKYRSTAGILSQSFFSIGFMLLSPVAWLAANAQQIIYFGAIIPACIIFLVPFLKESFRWQISNGKLEEGRESIKDFVRKCGGNITKNELDTIVEGEEPSAKSLSISDLFKSKTLVKVSLKMGFIWIVTTLTYYKLAIGENKGGLLIDNVLAGVIELVCLFPGGWLIQQKWCQRRWFLGITFFLAAGGISLDTLFTQLYVKDQKPLYLTLARIFRLPGRGAITVTFASIFVVTTELYPTVIRSTGLGFCSFSARIGAILAPQIDRLGDAGFAWAPGLIVTVMSVLAGFVCLLLPETNGIKLLNTVDEANEEYEKSSRL